MNKRQLSTLVLTLPLSLAVVACAPNTASTNSSSNSTNNATASAKAGSNNTTSNSTGTTANSTSNSAGGGSAETVASNSPLPGDLLIADRGNSRLLIVTPSKKIVWSMSLGSAGGGASSKGADDAFFTPDHKHIIINEEDNQVIAVIDIKTKKIVWQYGHPGKAGSGPGYLNTPDDAYMLPNGLVTVADIKNRRILFINKNKQIVKQYGNGVYLHNPPKSFAAPNGDTPLPDGGTMVTEIQGSYADRINKNGKLVYTVHFPNLSYPSDTQLLPDGNLLVADYVKPGKVEIVTPKGKVVWEYYKTSGPGMLNSPSLALPLPNGDIVVNDDKNNRVVVIDPKTNKIVWQYGHTGVAGTKPGYLNVPDGMDPVPPGTSF